MLQVLLGSLVVAFVCVVARDRSISGRKKRAIAPSDDNQMPSTLGFEV